MRNLQKKYFIQNRLINAKKILNNTTGSLTGYSVPINKNDIYQQMNIKSYNPFSNPNSFNHNFFKDSSGNEIYYSNGEYIRNLRNTTGTTGIGIIYD